MKSVCLGFSDEHGLPVEFRGFLLSNRIALNFTNFLSPGSCKSVKKWLNYICAKFCGHTLKTGGCGGPSLAAGQPKMATRVKFGMCGTKHSTAWPQFNIFASNFARP
jgi:hypothetical protein